MRLSVRQSSNRLERSVRKGDARRRRDKILRVRADGGLAGQPRSGLIGTETVTSTMRKPSGPNRGPGLHNRIRRRARLKSPGWRGVVYAV
jgi:hypothetical protein